MNALISACKYKKAYQWAKLVVWLNHFEYFSSSSSFGSVLFFSHFQCNQYIQFLLIWSNKKKNSMTEDKSMVKSDQCLRLFSSRRQPPLLVIGIRCNWWYAFAVRDDWHLVLLMIGTQLNWWLALGVLILVTWCYWWLTLDVTDAWLWFFLSILLCVFTDVWIHDIYSCGNRQLINDD